jgi:hypothetical protein
MQEAGWYVFCALYLIGGRPTHIGYGGASDHRHHRHDQAETKGASQTKMVTTGHAAIIAIAGKDSVAIA